MLFLSSSLIDNRNALKFTKYKRDIAKCNKEQCKIENLFSQILLHSANANKTMHIRRCITKYYKQASYKQCQHNDTVSNIWRIDNTLINNGSVTARPIIDGSIRNVVVLRDIISISYNFRLTDRLARRSFIKCISKVRKQMYEIDV